KVVTADVVADDQVGAIGEPVQALRDVALGRADGVELERRVAVRTSGAEFEDAVVLLGVGVDVNGQAGQTVEAASQDVGARLFDRRKGDLHGDMRTRRDLREFVVRPAKLWLARPGSSYELRVVPIIRISKRSQRISRLNGQFPTFDGAIFNPSG